MRDLRGIGFDTRCCRSSRGSGIQRSRRRWLGWRTRLMKRSGGGGIGSSGWPSRCWWKRRAGWRLRRGGWLGCLGRRVEGWCGVRWRGDRPPGRPGGARKEPDRGVRRGQGVRPTQADQAGATNLDFDAVERVLELAAAQAGSGTLDLGGGVRVMRSFDRMRFVNAGSGALPEPVAVTIPGRHEWNGTRVCLDVADAAPESAGCVRLKVTEGSSAAPLMLRGWRAGDHYHPAGHFRDQKIQEMFQQARVPSWQRPFWPILCQGTEILWARQFGAAAERAACSSEPAVWVCGRKVSQSVNHFGPLRRL